MPKNDDDMIGFQDFLSSQEDKRLKKGNRLKDSGHEMLSFLEREDKRLDLLSRLYTEKVEMIKSYPQDASIIIDLEKRLIETRNKVKDHLIKNDSHLRRNLREIYKNHFSSQYSLEELDHQYA